MSSFIKIFLSVAFLYIIITIFSVSYNLKQNFPETKFNIASIFNNNPIQAFKNLVAIDNAINYQHLPTEKSNQLNIISARNIDAGISEMQKHKAVFVGISRDNADDLPQAMNHIEKTGKLFSDYQVIIFENDSSDGTKITLDFWQSVNDKIKIITKDYNLKKRPSIKFLAEARNHYLHELSNKKYENFDIVIAVDMDMQYGFDTRGIIDSFSKLNQWDFVCANGIYKKSGEMYDAFAFRNANFPDKPILKTNIYDQHYWQENIPKIKEQIFIPGEPLVPIDSCFGGLAIYKYQAIQNCLYNSIDEDCEHVYFHGCLKNKNNAKGYMNPSMLIKYSHFDKFLINM